MSDIYIGGYRLDEWMRITAIKEPVMTETMPPTYDLGHTAAERQATLEALLPPEREAFWDIPYWSAWRRRDGVIVDMRMAGAYGVLAESLNLAAGTEGWGE